jgi:hypothetical protein
MWFNNKYWNCFASQCFLFKRLNVIKEKRLRPFDPGYQTKSNKGAENEEKPNTN